MLPRALRLPRRGFTEARRLARANSPHFLVSYGPAGDYGGAAVVVSKKVSASSVKRHVLKRRLMDLLKPYADPSRVLIIHVHPGALDVSIDELRSELNSLLGSILVER